MFFLIALSTLPDPYFLIEIEPFRKKMLITQLARKGNHEGVAVTRMHISKQAPKGGEDQHDNSKEGHLQHGAQGCNPDCNQMIRSPMNL